MKNDLFRRKNIHSFLVIIIVLIGGLCRFYNLNWDDGYNYHPDEMNITAAVSRIVIPGQMDPGFFAYNGFPIYVYRATAEILSRITSDTSWVQEWSQITLIGRFISAFLSTLSIYLIYWIGKNVISKNAALLAAYLTTVTVGLIQTAHYGVTESMLIFFMLILIVCAIRIGKEKKMFSRHWYAMALVSGLAIGTKTSALSFLIIPLVTWAILFYREKSIALFLRGVSFCVVTFTLCVIVSPYSFLNFSAFSASMKYESEVVWGTLQVPYTLQFQHTLPYWFFFKNLHWHAGPIIPTMGCMGMIWWLLVIIRTRREAINVLPLLLFGILYWGYVGGWYAKFIRYMVPLIPILTLSTCWLFDKLLNYLKARPLTVTLLLFTLITTTAWAGSFMFIYNAPSTRTAASQWIYTHIPENSVILTEHWDYRVPVHLMNNIRPPFQHALMRNFDPDTDKKVMDMSITLERGDYLILASRRLSGTIGKAYDKYPFTSRYYEKLFDGILGYTLIQTFSSYPTFWGLEINDDGAEETFQVFDHPVVHIFKNSEHLPASHLVKILREH